MQPNPQQGQALTRPTKRPRVVVACTRCKSRRQKCDNQFPACSNCAKAKLTCVFPENDYPSSYVKELENRVAFLESQAQNTQTRDRTGSESSHAISILSPGGSHVTTSSLNNAAPNLANSVGLLSLHAGADPQYFGVSSGVSLARMLEIAVHENARPDSMNIPSEIAESPFSNTSSEVPPKLAALPSTEIGATFIDSYLSYVQISFPFLSKARLWEIHQNRRELEEISTEEARHNFVLIQLVYAIGSRCLQLVGSANVTGIDPDGYYHCAMSKLDDDLSVGSIHTIQIALLVAIYALRSPSTSSVWDLCGLIIRQCLTLGFHRQIKTDENSAVEAEFKKRLFWSTYHLERRISLVLGRPLGMNDDEIDTEFPQHISEDDSNVASSNTGRNDISFQVLVLILDQLNSKSRLTLCRLTKAVSTEKVERKIAKRFQKLEEWKVSIFGSMAGADMDSSQLIYYTSRTPVQTPQSQPGMAETQRLTLLLNYHRARRLILQSILTDIHRPNQTFPFASFARSSGEVCQLNRRLHRLKPVPFTLLDLHSIFVAGLSIIYCVWKDPKLYDAETAADLGACSTVLYLIAEQWGAGAKKYRDAFELGAERTAEYAQSITQSHGSEQTQQGVFESHVPQGNNSSYDIGGNQILNQGDAYHTEPNVSGGWSNDNFDVWQMITQAVQTSDTRVERDVLDFAGIEEFMADEAMWWFNEGNYTGAFPT